MKRKRLLMAMVIVLVLSMVIVGIIFVRSVIIRNKFKSVHSVSEFDDFKELRYEDISIMTLQTMPTQPEWVEIDDKNMIGEMWQYFQGLELSFREYIDSSKMNGGGGWVTTFKTNVGNVSIFYDWHDKRVYVCDGYDEYYYEIVSSVMDNPFEKLYSEWKEKHGGITPWG